MTIEGSFNIYVARFLRERDLWGDFLDYLNDNPSETLFTKEEMEYFEGFRGMWSGKDRETEANDD